MNEAVKIADRIIKELPQVGTSVDDVFNAFALALTFFISNSASSSDMANSAVYYVADKTLNFLSQAEVVGITNWTKPAEGALS